MESNNYGPTLTHVQVTGVSLGFTGTSTEYTIYKLTVKDNLR